MSAGTISLTNGSTSVTGNGTAFTTDLAANDFIVCKIGGATYTLGVSAIGSATALSLTQPFTGPTTSGVAWYAVPNQTLVGITTELAANVTSVYRSVLVNDANWNKVFSQNQNITVVLKDGSTFTGPSWGYLSSQMLRKDGSVAMTGALTTAALEITAASPYIDFHYNNSTADYTARILHSEAQAIEVSAASGNISFRVNGGLRVGGASYSGGINLYRGNGDANALWGFNCSDGNLNIVRGSAAGGLMGMGDSFLDQVRGVRGKRGAGGVYQANTWQIYWNASNPSAPLLEAWVDTTQVGNISLSSTSDKGLKKDITYREDASKALAEVLEWRPADFKMKARGIIPETAEQLGFIANDLVKVSPECVSGKGLPDDYDIEADPNNDTAYYLNHIPMIAKLAQALQAQHELVQEQRGIIKAMGTRLKDLDGLDG